MNFGNNAYKPVSFWSWNGDMRAEEIRWQINGFRDKGFGGFFIHSRAGRLTEYMGEEWLAACAAAVDEAEKTGLDAWLYDEDGWPSGFAGGAVNGCGDDYKAKQLRFCIGRPAEESAHVIAAYRRENNGDYYRINEANAAGTDLFCYYNIVQHYVDIMSKKVVAKFIEATHEVYKKHFGRYFGSVIKGIFTDEPQLPGGPCWSSALADKYSVKYGGESILDRLWLMYVNGTGYQSFRYRFWSCVSELVNESYVCQINDWCNANNLLLTGHFPAEDGLTDQVSACGGVMRLYNNMGLPAIDHLGNRFASAVLMKQVTSVTHRRNIPYVLSESFGCAGWDISFKELLGIAGWQAVFGVNMLCVHLSAYTITGRRKRDYPAFFSYQEPWWEKTGVVFEAIRRLNSLIGEGHRETCTAVLNPIRSIWCSSTLNHRYDSKFLSAEYRELVNNLLDIHIDFDLLDESELDTAKINGNSICAGAMSYSLIIVPQSVTLSGHTAQMLIDYAAAGGNIIFINGRPESVEGLTGHPLVKKVRELKAHELQNTRNILQKHFRANPVQENFRLLDLRMENEISGIVSYYGKTACGAVAYLFNHMSGHSISMIMRLKNRCRIRAVNLETGELTDISASFDGTFTYAILNVESKSGLLLEITGGAPALPVCANAQHKTETLDIAEVTPLDDNCLTLDFGRFKINGGGFSEYKAVIHMLDEIYAGIAGSKTDSDVCIEYDFNADFEKMPESICLAAEKIDMLNISINGIPVTKRLGWWIDKGIIKYDITGLVVNGVNTVTLEYTIPSTNQVNDLNGKFESERNRFFYRIEPESVYICGGFDVRCDKSVTDNVTYHSVKCAPLIQPVFTLTDYTAKSAGDITPQGMWFYRGDCRFCGNFDFDGTGEVFVKTTAMHCTFADVYVNDCRAGMIMLDNDKVNITKLLHAGSNAISVVAAGHNRNLMGPHHHRLGALHFSGPSSFAGVYGFEDFVNPEIRDKNTWTDNYSFLPFGVDGIAVITAENDAASV